jgi:hypothetical protein
MVVMTIETSGRIGSEGQIEPDQPVNLAYGDSVRLILETPDADDPRRPIKIEATGWINQPGQIEVDRPIDLESGAMVQVYIETVSELRYDDDPEWNGSLTKSLNILQQFAAKARKDHEEGQTSALDPDRL